MRQNANKYGAVVLFLFAVAIIGCGADSDILDELGWRWQTDGSPTVYDGSTERRIIDPTTQDDAKIEVTFVSNSDVDTDLFLRNITFTFEGDGNGPDIPTNVNSGYNGLLSGNGGTFTYTLYFMSATDKAEYLAAIGGSAVGFSSDYSCNIVANFSYSRDSGSDDVTISDYTFFTVAQAATPTPTPTP